MFAFLAWNDQPVQVLLVEDSVGDAALVRGYLEQSKVEFEVRHVLRSSEALEYLAGAEVDVVVLDLGLPDSKGLDTLLKMRGAAAGLPIVVLTGINDESLSMQALEHGAQDYLVKGMVDGDLLVHSVCHAIERHRLHTKLIENQKLESLASLAGGIAHDFNNLLTVILGRAELARAEGTPVCVMKEAFTQIRDAGDRAAELCKQLLAYSGKGNCVQLLYDLSVVVEEMSPFLQQSVAGDVQLKHQLENSMPLIRADITQLRQLVRNLVQNAAEAIGSKQGIITIGTRLIHADDNYLGKTLWGLGLAEGDYVCLEVSDTGCGIDSAIRTRIFDPFFSTKYFGRGLGLSAVQGIVRACHGALQVVSERGKGSTFTILFPVSAAPPRKEKNRAGREVSLRAPSGQGIILVVDDEKSIQELLGESIESLGFKVLYASDGMEGVESYRNYQKNIDLVLLDMTMPHLNGEQTLKKIRQINPHARVVLMSGYPKEVCANLFEEEVPNGFIQKPFRLADLSGNIQVALEGSPHS